LEENENPTRARFRASDLTAALAVSPRAAITAQRFCSISVMDDLIGCDGIGETTV
jgi:hypothetical protein